MRWAIILECIMISMAGLVRTGTTTDNCVLTSEDTWTTPELQQDGLRAVLVTSIDTTVGLAQMEEMMVFDLLDLSALKNRIK